MYNLEILYFLLQYLIVRHPKGLSVLKSNFFLPVLDEGINRDDEPIEEAGGREECRGGVQHVLERTPICCYENTTENKLRKGFA